MNEQMEIESSFIKISVTRRIIIHVSITFNYLFMYDFEIKRMHSTGKITGTSNA